MSESQANLETGKGGLSAVTELVVTVNRQKVIFTENNVTGYQIKVAAIAQGVKNVSLEFDLFLVDGERQVPIGDQQHLVLRRGFAFLMLTPDHNS